MPRDGEIVFGDFEQFNHLDDTEAAIDYLVTADNPENRLTDENRARAAERLRILGVVSGELLPPQECFEADVLNVDFNQRRRVL